jgi:hypothetical protein
MRGTSRPQTGIALRTPVRFCVLPVTLTAIADGIRSCRSPRPTFIIPKRKGNAPILISRSSVAFAYSRGMVLLMIFCPGEINRGSRKDGSDYNQSCP